jgi:hypothetical protein
LQERTRDAGTHRARRSRTRTLTRAARRRTRTRTPRRNRHPLHQEEVGAAIVYELGTMFRADLDDLGLSEAQVVQRFPDGQEELAVVSALG